MERSLVALTPEKASNQLFQLGYDKIENVPVGRGNDYLTAVVKIAGGGHIKVLI